MFTTHQWHTVVLQGVKPSNAFLVLNAHAAADAVCGAPAQALAAAVEKKRAHQKDSAGKQLNSASDWEVCHTLSIRGKHQGSGLTSSNVVLLVHCTLA